ncbi:MAG: DUF1573 domain-containing protein [Eubacteriales bacterium]
MKISVKDMQFEDFQQVVSENLIRNKSLLDVLSKLNIFFAKSNRAVTKAITSCGCMQIHASKQNLDGETEYSSLTQQTQTHLEGELCENCKSIIEHELGETMFFMAALCETLGLSLYDIILNEKKTLETLGKFNLK